jgi:hypothetical protein
MLVADDLQAAIAQEALFQDGRITQYWDGERALGRLVSRGLKLAAPVAWDIYLLYAPGAMWKGEKMPTPNFWMHQLAEPAGLRLDPDRLKAEVHNAIERAEK